MPDEAVKRSLLVLIVEDELFIVLDLEAVVTGEGHAVPGPAASVSVAPDLLRQNWPDAAILAFNLGEPVTAVAEHLFALQVLFVLASVYDKTDLLTLEGLKHAPNVGKPANEAKLLDFLNGVDP